MMHDRRRPTYGDWMVGIDWRTAALAVWFVIGTLAVGLGGGVLLAKAILS